MVMLLGGINELRLGAVLVDVVSRVVALCIGVGIGIVDLFFMRSVGHLMRSVVGIDIRVSVFGRSWLRLSSSHPEIDRLLISILRRNSMRGILVIETFGRVGPCSCSPLVPVEPLDFESLRRANQRCDCHRVDHQKFEK